MKINYDNNPKILNDFLDYLVLIENFSRNSLEVYNTALLQFFNFIRIYNDINLEIKDLNIFVFSKVKKDDILAFLVYLNFKRNNNPNTRELKMCAIRKFYKWLVIKNPSLKINNPMLSIECIQKIKRLPKYLNLEQAKQIQSIFNRSNSKYYIRNNAIISLFLSTGLRLSELININLNDINFSNKSIRVYGKNSKERYVYFSEKCKGKLIKYLKIRNKNSKIIYLNQPLFITQMNKRISKRTVEKICEKAYKLMGLGDRGYTVHTLRHTAATIIYQYVNQDILLLKEFLRHESIVSTEIYTHVNDKILKEAINNHPLANYCIKRGVNK